MTDETLRCMAAHAIGSSGCLTAEQYYGDESGGCSGWEVVEGVRCVECPGCGFTFGAGHTTGDTGAYSCPLCGHGEEER